MKLIQTRTLVGAAFIAVGLLMQGCRNDSGVVSSSGFDNNAEQTEEYFKIGVDFLHRLAEFDPEEGTKQTTYQFNRWIELAKRDKNWRPEPMIGGLPRYLRAVPHLQRLDELKFIASDIKFLQEAYWLQQISQWSAKQDLDESTTKWLDEVEKEHGEDRAYDLSIAIQLFDWVTRNIQLDPLRKYPVKRAGPSTEGGRGNMLPIQQGAPGPGYTAYVRQTLLFGRADAWARAHVFIQLARQRNLDVVMLAVDDAKFAPQPYPWLPALMVDGELYLFDTALGLPVPGPGGIGVATLSEALANGRELLKWLDVGKTFTYEPVKYDLDKLVALVDAIPESLSLRMRMMERAFKSKDRIVLSIDATELADRVKKCKGITNASLWNLPFETLVYRYAMMLEAQRNPMIARGLWVNEGFYETLNPMSQGRQFYFCGQFDNTEGNSRLGAKGYYLKARLPDKVLKQIATSADVQKQLNLIRVRQNDLQWKLYLQDAQRSYVDAKKNVSYWLGLLHFEEGKHESAIDWLKQRTLAASENGPWTAGAQYNLARVYEATGEIDQARQLLLKGDSAQKHGNFLRARLLRLRSETSEGE